MNNEMMFTVNKHGEFFHLFIDRFPTDSKDKFAYTGQPIDFVRRPLFAQDSGEPTLILAKEEIKELIKELQDASTTSN